MIKSLFRESPAWMQLILSLLVAIVVFATVFVVGIIIAIPLFNLNFASLGSLGNIDKDSIHIFKYLQILQGIGLFILPAIALGYIYSDKPFNWLGFKQASTLEQIILVVAIVPVSLPVINLLAELNASMKLPEAFARLEAAMRAAEDNAAHLTELFLATDSYGGLAFNLFMIAIIPAFGEEFLFRGVIQTHLTKITKNKHWGVIISAILFSAFHMQFYGFLPRLALGILFGYLLVWSSNMWLPILAHFINNAFAVTAYFFLSKSGQTDQLEQLEAFGVKGNTLYASLSLAALLGYLIWVFYKHSKEQETKQKQPL